MLSARWVWSLRRPDLRTLYVYIALAAGGVLDIRRSRRRRAVFFDGRHSLNRKD